MSNFFRWYYNKSKKSLIYVFWHWHLEGEGERIKNMELYTPLVSRSGSVAGSSSGLKPSSWGIGYETEDWDCVCLFFRGYYRGNLSIWSNHRDCLQGSNRPFLGLGSSDWGGYSRPLLRLGGHGRPLLGLGGDSRPLLDWGVVADLSLDLGGL